MGQQQQVEMNVFDANSPQLEQDLHAWLVETADIQLRLAVIYQRKHTDQISPEQTKQTEIDRFLTRLAHLE